MGDILLTISVIIPQFCNIQLTLRCVRSLIAHEKQARLQVIVVDDGSPLPLLQSFQRQAPPNIEIVRSTKNRGVTHAWNAGAELASGEVLIFLNNDVISRGEWCHKLVAPLQSQQTLLTGAALRFEPQFPARFTHLLINQQLLQGWCLAISRSLFVELSRFDERFVLYYSDSDLQCRLIQRSHSARAISAISDLPLDHQAHQTTRNLPDRQKQWLADRKVFLQKWAC